jgi:hypothetical protein
MTVIFKLIIAIPFSRRQHGSVPGPPPSHCMLCFVLLYCKHIRISIFSLLCEKFEEKFPDVSGNLKRD